MINRPFQNGSKPDEAEKLFKTVVRVIGAFWIMWFVWVLVCLAALGGVIYVAIHFISKYW